MEASVIIMPDKFVIISAGGKGDRMGTSVPKQFLELEGFPVIMHTIRAFVEYSPQINIIIVLPETGLGHWDDLCNYYNFNIKHQTCTGGDTRFQSVKNGLAMIKEDGLVAIHDAVRPLVSPGLIGKCFLMAEQMGNAVPVTDVTDSVREVNGEENRPVDRSKFKLIQTPQVFEVSLIKKAYEQAYRPTFTDDAGVVEFIGTQIHLLMGEKKNIKITTLDDMYIASALLKGNH